MADSLWGPEPREVTYLTITVIPDAGDQGDTVVKLEASFKGQKSRVHRSQMALCYVPEALATVEQRMEWLLSASRNSLDIHWGKFCSHFDGYSDAP